MPLALVNTGTKVKLVTIEAGNQLKNRLLAMGLIPGVEIEVVSNSFFGPFLIAVKGSRVMLGRGIAQKIFVQ
jgi:Fe2+ transport system protein FeoA